MNNTVHNDSPAIRFEYGQDGGMTVAVYGDKLEYQGVFDKEKVVAAVSRLGLRLKDRANLYLDAADRCQDEEATEMLIALAHGYAKRANQIDKVRQQYDIPLTPISDAMNDVNSRFAIGRNEGLPTSPPPMMDAFVLRLPIVVTKEMKEHMVRALEGTFVPYNRGEVALQALGLVQGRMSCYVNWLRGQQKLTGMMLFLLGRITIVLDDELVVNGCCLPAGSYGNGVPIVLARSVGERHWQMVAALFRDAMGRPLNSASLRSVAPRVGSRVGSEFGDIVYLFSPLIFDANNFPRPNGLFISEESERVDLVGRV